MNYRKVSKDKTILVTGGAGAIGGNLVRALDRLRYKKDHYS